MGSTWYLKWVRTGFDMGTTWVRHGYDMVKNRVRHGYDIVENWVQHGTELGTTWVILGIRGAVLRFTTALLFELMDSQIIINGYPNNSKNGVFIGYTKINYGISNKIFAVTFGQKF